MQGKDNTEEHLCKTYARAHVAICYRDLVQIARLASSGVIAEDGTMRYVVKIKNIVIEARFWRGFI